MRSRLVLMVLGCLLSAAVQGASLERLVMPGEVIQGHAKYEDQCDRCHSKFEQTSQNTLCRDCHKEVDADMHADKGFHGRMPNAQHVECRTCHTDHKGRKANIVPLDPETFDHERTDFALKGAHARATCASCHAAGKRRRAAAHECASCHKEDDKHRGRLGKGCADCHDTESWTKARFNHDKTAFRLEGAHQNTLCAACHPGERYKDTPKECVACHRIDDVHAGRYGAKCADCHSAREWKTPRFDHDKTQFPLKNKHRDVACEACHTGDVYEDKLATTCNGCHETDDVHRGKNGAKCESCHDTRGWGKAAFDHNRKTEFPLHGAHVEVKCESCHIGDVYKVKLDTGCISCHRGDDRHQGAQGKDCASCHNDTSWSGKIRFDHDLSPFPLIGMHAAAPCEACHLTPAYKNTRKECARCHTQEDTHKRRLGTQCAACHNPNAWSLWKFEHDRRTQFRLTGKHAGVDCLACHREPMSRRVTQSAACDACHRQDDIHLGRFSRQCERCHSTESFKEIKTPLRRRLPN